jgi:hypothetical protein
VPALSDLLVGWRERDPIRNELLTKYAGRCYSCGNRVFVPPSAFEILRRDDCDARLICSFCDRRYPDEWPRVMGDG